MAEIDQQAPEPPPKRKPDLDNPPTDPKKTKLEDTQVPQPDSNPQSVDHDSAEPEEEPADGEGNATASNGKQAVDKGKGIMEEVEDSGSDDDGESEAEGEEDDGEFVDDPLAEVDLNNILPSRTRRRAVMPGEFVVNDMDDDEDEDDEDEDVGEGVDDEDSD